MYSIMWKSDRSDKIQREFCSHVRTIYGCTTKILIKLLEKKLDRNYTRILRPVGWGVCRILRLHIYRWVRLIQRVSFNPVGWDCRIHRLHLCRRVSLLQRVSFFSKSAGALEYTDSISADGQDSLKECPFAQSAGTAEYPNCITADG